MKKSILFIAMLLCSFAASAKVITAVPAGDIAWYLSQAEAGDVIELTDGIYDESSSINFAVNNLTIKAAEGAKPVIKTQGQWMVMNIKATTTFEGITFDSESKSGNSDDNDMYAFKLSANATFKNCVFQDYAKACIQVDEGIVVNSLVIDDCVFDGSNTTPIAIYALGSIENCTIEGTEFKNFTEYAITASDYHKGRFDNISINNSLIHDCGFSVIYLYPAANDSEKQSCSNFELKNSTIYNIGNQEQDRGVVDIRDNASIATPQTILIDHVTLYNFSTKASYGGFMIYKSGNATISNCIAMNPADVYNLWINPFVAYTGATVSNCVNFNCGYVDNGATQSGLAEADPMFVDAANGNFQLYAESPAIGMGDPRWGVKAGIQPGEGKLKAAVDAAEVGATIVLGDETYEVSSSISFNKEGLTIVAAEGTKPVIKLTGEWTSLKLSASTTFDGITIDGNQVAQYPVTSTGTNASTFVFTNCEFKNYTKWAITNEYQSSHVDNVIIDKCLFHDGGSAVYFNPTGYDSQHSCSYFKMTNTTIYNINYNDWGVGVIHVSANGDATGEQNEVEIDHITMYNVSTKEYGAITVRKSSKLSVTNSIIANPASNSDKYAFYIYGGNVTNTLYHNSKVNSDAPTMSTINADPLFVNAAENNFQLYANSPAVGAGTDGNTLGDPRWGVSAKVLGKRINVTPDQASSLQWIIQNAESDLKSGDTLVLADGLYEVAYSITFNKPDICIMAAENAKPVIKLTQEGTVLTIQTTTSFDGITFDGGNVAKYLIATTGVNPGTLTINNCEFRNWTYWALSNQYEETASIDSVIINNTIFHDGAQSAISFNNKAPEGMHSCNYFSLTNSTIYNVVSTEYAGIVHVSSNGEATGMQNKVIIDHVTMYNLDGGDLGIIAVRKSSDLTISNTIIANPAAGERASYVYGGVAENVVYYNVSQDGDLTYTNCITADPLFVDAANNDFTLQATSPAIGAGTDGSNLGDPRWGVEEPAFITLTTGDNSAVIAANINKTVDVVIERSFTANDGYYTLCVPFNMDPSVIGKAYYLGDIKRHVTGEGIDIDLVEEKYELSAGMPYLVLPKEDMNQLVVKNVTILEDPAAGQDIENEELNVKIFFQGLYSADGQTNGSTEYYVGASGYLYKGVVEKRGLCGLFTITDTQGQPAKVRARVVAGKNGVTGVEDIITNDAPQKMIENGQLIIIRNGLKYNVQGQRL